MNQQKWIGHRSARRTLTEHGWLYRDPANQSLAIKALFFKVSLPAMDDGIERLEAERVPAGKELRKRRELLFGDFLRHLEWITTRVKQIKIYENDKQRVSDRNTTNAHKPRLSSRTVDHERIAKMFLNLTGQGRTRREANGIIFERGLATRPTISRITRQLTNNIAATPPGQKQKM